MLNVKLSPLFGMFLILFLVAAACSPTPSTVEVTPTPALAIARHVPPRAEWGFAARERGVVTGHGVNFAVQFAVMEPQDPSLIMVIYTLAAEPGIHTRHKQLTPVDSTSLVDQHGRAYPWVMFTSLGCLDNVEIGALGFKLDRRGVTEFTLVIPALESADGQRVEGPWGLPLFERYPVGEQQPTGGTFYREGYVIQGDAKISFNGWGFSKADRVGDMLADVGLSDEEEEAMEWGFPAGQSGGEKAPAPTSVAPAELSAQPQPTPTPAVSPGSPLLTGVVGTLRFESMTDPSRVRYLFISVSQDGNVRVLTEE